MLITELKAREAVDALTGGKVFLLICHGCREIRFPEAEVEALRKELKLSESKKTTDDHMFTVETVSCLGACSSAPALTLNDEIYPSMTPEKAVALINSLKENV